MYSQFASPTHGKSYSAADIVFGSVGSGLASDTLVGGNDEASSNVSLLSPSELGSASLGRLADTRGYVSGLVFAIATDASTSHGNRIGRFR